MKKKSCSCGGREDPPPPVLEFQCLCVTEANIVFMTFLAACSFRHALGDTPSIPRSLFITMLWQHL